MGLFFQEIINLGGSSLLYRYNNSLSLLLSTVFPEQEWLPWKFGKSPKSFWENHDNKVKFMGWLSEKLHIKNMEDWYKVATWVTMATCRKIIFQGKIK